MSTKAGQGILVRALADAGVSMVFVSPKDMDHSWLDPNGAVDPRVLAPTLEFLREHL
jgi:hypothetical protein